MNECTFCHKSLEDLEELHAMHDMLFCSKECAIAHLTEDIIANAATAAEEMYDDNVETVDSSILDGKGEASTKPFKVIIEEHISQAFTVEAYSKADALNRAKDRYKDGTYVLDEGNVVYVCAEVDDDGYWVCLD